MITQSLRGIVSVVSDYPLGLLSRPAFWTGTRTSASVSRTITKSISSGLSKFQPRVSDIRAHGNEDFQNSEREMTCGLFDQASVVAPESQPWLFNPRSCFRQSAFLSATTRSSLPSWISVAEQEQSRWSAARGSSKTGRLRDRVLQPRSTSLAQCRQVATGLNSKRCTA